MLSPPCSLVDDDSPINEKLRLKSAMKCSEDSLRAPFLPGKIDASV
jgi:hypothetical protein